MKRAMRETRSKPPAREARTHGSDIVLINARLVDPASGRDEPGGLLIRDGLIADLGAHLRRNAPEGAEVIDCGGHLVCPGLVDMHVFTGEPGAEHRETLKTASLAAAAGGVTTIVCMPNTDPVIDDVALVDYIERRSRDRAIVHVHTFAALTKGLKGQEMTEIGLLQRAGAVAFTNGKASVTSARVMRNALAYARDFDALVVHYAEDAPLAEAGVMNEGEVATRLGLPAVPKVAETLVLERDLRLVGITGARYHAPLISCAESLDVVRAGKAKGLAVTCGVSINHLVLNEEAVVPYRTFFKLRPPLRAEADRLAMVAGIASGEIDVIVSCHDPHGADVKRQPFAEAIDGAIGLETLLSAALQLYHKKSIGLLPLLQALTANPARILGLPVGRLDKGAPADIILVDLDAHWVVDPPKLRSRAKNTPFDEAKLPGRVLRTFVAGKPVYQYGEPVTA
jgi:dihydroorotase